MEVLPTQYIEEKNQKRVILGFQDKGCHPSLYLFNIFIEGDINVLKESQYIVSDFWMKLH